MNLPTAFDREGISREGSVEEQNDGLEMNDSGAFMKQGGEVIAGILRWSQKCEVRAG